MKLFILIPILNTWSVLTLNKYISHHLGLWNCVLCADLRPSVRAERCWGQFLSVRGSSCLELTCSWTSPTPPCHSALRPTLSEDTTSKLKVRAFDCSVVLRLRKMAVFQTRYLLLSAGKHGFLSNPDDQTSHGKGVSSEFVSNTNTCTQSSWLQRTDGTCLYKTPPNRHFCNHEHTQVTFAIIWHCLCN